MDFNYSEVIQIVYRSLISLITLFLITKLIGKKQVSQLSLFDYVIGISIGNFSAEMIINLESNEVYGILAVVIFGVIAYLVSLLTMKSINLRKFLTSSPTVLIQSGNIVKKGLKETRFDLNDLLEVLRCKGYFDISQIEYAVMEANGEVSVLPKVEYRPVITKDLNLKLNEEELVANVVIDGKIMPSILENMNKSKAWLMHELEVKGINLENIILATLDSNEKLTIYKQNFNEKIKNILE